MNTVDLVPVIELRALEEADLAAASALHAGAFGPGRFSRTAYRVREGASLLSRHCRAVSLDGVLIGCLTMTEIVIGDGREASSRDHWLLGPLVVHDSRVNQGIGARLIKAALHSVLGDGTAHSTVILVGDLPYYGRFGFERTPRRQIDMPGPVDPARMLIWRGDDGGRPLPAGLVRAA